MPLWMPPLVFQSGTALVAQVPDSTATGGNARGANAVDWQRVRAAAVEVAAGERSTISGGAFNALSGVGAWCPGGISATDRGVAGRGVWASGTFAARDDAQAGVMVLRRTSTDATAGRITADGTAFSAINQLVLANNSSVGVTVEAVGRQIAGSAGTVGDTAFWSFTAVFKRGASAASTVVVDAGGGAPGRRDAAAAAWTLSVTADTTNGAIGFVGTGEVNKTIQWVVNVSITENAG